MKNYDTFTQAYLNCALWSSTDGGDKPLDKNYSILDISSKTLEQMVADCEKFQKENNLTGFPLSEAGHCFWLNRNRHGSGFWDSTYGATEEQLEKLSNTSHKYGEFNLMVGDDEKIYN